MSIQPAQKTILLAEDDPLIRRLETDVLENAGYRVIVASDGEEAINKYILYKDIVNLLVLDIILPKKNGKEVYQEINRLTPDIKTIFISGYSPDIIIRESILNENVLFMPKPVSPIRLVDIVREMLDKIA